MNRPYVKFHGTTDEAVSIESLDVTFVADPGAQLTSTNNGVLLEIRGASHVVIYDLEITGASGPGSTGVGISLPAGFSGTMELHGAKVTNSVAAGIVVASGTLTITQSTLSGNRGGGILVTGGGTLTITQSTLSGNRGGGISVSGNDAAFDITNSFIVYNGVASGPGASQFGGVALLPNKAGSRFEYNTVAFNQSDGTFAGGISCLGAMVTAAGNILYGNAEGAATSDATQKNGDCQFGSTLALGSMPGDLGFKSPRANPIDFHLSAASPSTAVDAGRTCTGSDFDGQARPLGNGCDLGADEAR